MREVVYNACYGGFGMSDLAEEMLAKRKGKTSFEYTELGDILRHDEDLVWLVRELGEGVNDSCSNLRIAQVEGLYRISEYDGYESVVEQDEQIWY